MIELTIKLDTDRIEAAVREAWQREFCDPNNSGYRSSDDTQAGWREVRRQVQAYIQTMDLSAEIAVAAKARVANTVDEAVTAMLREKAKQRAKEMMRDGTLLSSDV